MEFEEACIILDAPEHLKATIIKEYKITSKKEKHEALSGLKDAEEWLQRQLKLNGRDWLEMTKDTETYTRTVKDSLERLTAVQGIMKEAHRHSLHLQEANELKSNMFQVGFNEAILAFFKYTTDEDYRKKITSKANAIGTIKEKIDYIKAVHGFDKKTGDLIIW